MKLRDRALLIGIISSFGDHGIAPLRGDFCGAGGNACAAVVSWGRGSSLWCAAEKCPIQEG
jgi:hypothetical protein